MVDWVATDWAVWGSSPGGGDFFHTFQTDRGAHQFIRKMDTVSLLWGCRGRGVALIAHPF